MYNLEKIFANNIELRDWAVSAKGKKKVLKINKKIREIKTFLGS